MANFNTLSTTAKFGDVFGKLGHFGTAVSTLQFGAQLIDTFINADSPEDAFMSLLGLGDPDALTLVFGRTKHGSEKLMKSLVTDGFNAASIHGNKSQGQRDRAIKAFRDGTVTILVATDVAALEARYESFVRKGLADAEPRQLVILAFAIVTAVVLWAGRTDLGRSDAR